jgi:hypothetical protein
MEELKKYYESAFYIGQPPFYELSNKQRKKLGESTGFAIWKVSQSVEKLREEINTVLLPLGVQLKPKFPNDRIG